MNYLTRTATLLALLVIYIGSYALNAHAEIRAEWLALDGSETIGQVLTLQSDGFRLFAGTREGLYISRDNGRAWGSSQLRHPCGTIAIRQNSVYVGTIGRGMFRSDNRGNTWDPKNTGLPRNDIHQSDGEEGLLYPRVQQILVTNAGTAIAVMYNQGTYTSTDRGETWHSVIDRWALPWRIGTAIWSMTEFGGNLWATLWPGRVKRSHDRGHTWQWLGEYPSGRIVVWAELNNQLYAAGHLGFARWNEQDYAWEELSEGLPARWAYISASITSLAVHRGRIFAGLHNHGVYMFDERSETWIPAGLQGLTVTALVSHQSDLYAATYATRRTPTDVIRASQGIFRTAISIVQPHNKAPTTWGAIKQK